MGLNAFYFAPTHFRKELEEEIRYGDTEPYSTKIISNIIEASFLASAINFGLINVSLGILNYLKLPLIDYDHIQGHQPEIIGISVGVPLLTNICSGLYEQYRNQRVKKDIRKGNEILEEIVSEIRANN